MINDSYDVNDFTEDEYKKYLDIAKEKFSFKDFNENSSERHIVWRHDVDFSVHRALQLAEIEHQKGVKATYFILLRSEFYNIFEIEVKECVKKIISLGHKIGLHLDLSSYTGEINSDRLLTLISYEANILEYEFSIRIDSFAFHNTSELTKTFKEDYYGEYLNVYSTSIINKYYYCSDSSGFWLYDKLSDVLKRDDIKYLQISTHPNWWMPEKMLPRDRIIRAVQGRANKTIEKYDNLLLSLGRVNAGKF